MSLNRLTRTLRRSLYSGVIWAMAPLAAFSGLPTVRCGCEKCHCGKGCFDGHSALFSCCDTAEAATAVAGRPTGSEKRQVQPEPSCCCGGKHQTGAHRRSGDSTPGDRVSVHQRHCNTQVTSHYVVRPAVTALDDTSAAVSTVLAVEFVGHYPASRHPETHTTGPPINLVVALCHLLI